MTTKTFDFRCELKTSGEAGTFEGYGSVFNIEDQGGDIVCYSGDLAVEDEEGFFSFIGRNDAMIKSSGYRISPSEVEEAIMATGHFRQVAVIGLPDLGRKVSLRDDRMVARLAIVDPALTDGCPKAVTLASGLDAVTQVIEPYVSIKANPFTDTLAESGLKAVRDGLFAWYEAGENAATGRAPAPDRALYFEYNVAGQTPPYADFEAARRNRPRRCRRSAPRSRCPARPTPPHRPRPPPR